MEVDEPVSEGVVPQFDVNSPEFQKMVSEIAASFGMAEHSDPVVTLRAIEKRIVFIKEAKLKAAGQSAHAKNAMELEDVPLGMPSTGNPHLDNAVRVLRLLHGNQMRELQTRINSTVAQVQQLTANPRADLALGRIGR